MRSAFWSLCSHQRFETRWHLRAICKARENMWSLGAMRRNRTCPRIHSLERTSSLDRNLCPEPGPRTCAEPGNCPGTGTCFEPTPVTCQERNLSGAAPELPCPGTYEPGTRNFAEPAPRTHSKPAARNPNRYRNFPEPVRTRPLPRRPGPNRPQISCCWGITNRIGIIALGCVNKLHHKEDRT